MKKSVTALQFRIIDETLKEPLAEFFRSLKRKGDDKYFHPHPFTDEEAKRRAQYSGKDLYYVLMEGDKVLGYGMLRGWDEGYEVPSLGIAIHPSARRTGLGELFIDFLHTVAKRRGVSKIRIKVYTGNMGAVALYKRLGYIFQSEKKGEMVGFVHL